MASCHYANVTDSTWIIDSGASGHMTGNFSILSGTVRCRSEARINLPTGHTSGITHSGCVKLENEMVYVPDFKHNLMSV